MFATHTIVEQGQAGLATSRCLTDAPVDHVVLERGPPTGGSARRGSRSGSSRRTGPRGCRAGATRVPNPTGS